MRLKEILVLMMVMSCSSISVQQDQVPSEEIVPVVVNRVIRNGYKIEESFIDHVKVFEKYYGEEIGIEITFANIPGDKAGICYYSDTWLYYPEIIIDLEYWNDSPQAEREMTILHELGHCILGRAHLDDEIDSTPISLMYRKSFSNKEYKLEREEYIKELFNLIKKPMLDPFLAL